MSVEENLRAVDRWVEAYNAHDFEAFAKPFAESANYHSPSHEEPLKGREEIRKYFAQHPASFPDARLQKVESFGQADTVCVECIWAATHKEPITGPAGQEIPPTNKLIRLPFATIFQFDRGEITEAREYYDRDAYYKQLGLSR